MSGGGRFNQNMNSRSNRRPGVYIDKFSIPRPNIFMGERGTSAGLVEMPWYIPDEVVTVTAQDFINGRALRHIGTTGKHVSLLLSGCIRTRLMSSNVGGTRASATIPLIGGKLIVTARKFGTFGNELLISIQRQPALFGDIPQYMVSTHIIGHETSDKPNANQTVGYPTELNDNDFVTFTVVSDSASVPVFPSLPPVNEIPPVDPVTTPTPPIATIPPNMELPPIDDIDEVDEIDNENGENNEENDNNSEKEEENESNENGGNNNGEDNEILNYSGVEHPTATIPSEEIPQTDEQLINPPIGNVDPSEIPPLDELLINPPIGEIDLNDLPPAGLTGEFKTILTHLESIAYGNQFTRLPDGQVKRFRADFEHQPQAGNRLLYRKYSEFLPITVGITQISDYMVDSGLWSTAFTAMTIDQIGGNYTLTIAEINENNTIVAYSKNVFPAVDVDENEEDDESTGETHPGGQAITPDWIDFPNNERFAVTATWTRHTPQVPATFLNPNGTPSRHYFRIATDHVPAEGNRLVLHWQNRTNADVSPAQGITIGASSPGTGNFTSGNEISRTYAQLNATHGAYARVLELNPQNLVVRFGWVWVMRNSVPVQVQPTIQLTTKIARFNAVDESQNESQTEPQPIRFVEVAGIVLTGGSNGSIDMQRRIPNFLRKIKNYSWQCLGWQYTDERHKQLIQQSVRRMRDESGKYVQVAMSTAHANHESCINVEQAQGRATNPVTGECFTIDEIALMVASMTAGADLTISNTNRPLPIQLEFENEFDNEEIVDGLHLGKIMFSRRESGILKIEQDINSLHTFTPTKQDEFAKNNILRTLDEIATTMRVSWENRFTCPSGRRVGMEINDEFGRETYKANVHTYFTQLQSKRAIQNHHIDNLQISQGNKPADVVLVAIVQPTDVMERLFLTLNVSTGVYFAE